MAKSKTLKSVTEILGEEKHHVGQVDAVDGEWVTYDSWTFGWHDRYGPLPEVGDDIVTIGGLGRPIRGIVVNWELRWYQTQEEWQTEFDKIQLEKERKERIEFYLEGGDYARFLLDYRSLSETMRRRIQRFVSNGDDWIRKFGAYEMSVCQDAELVAKYISKGGDPTKIDWKVGKAIGMFDGHSGNSFDCAVVMGRYLADGQDSYIINQMHGALTPLVGCDEYGCSHDVVPG